MQEVAEQTFGFFRLRVATACLLESALTQSPYPNAVAILFVKCFSVGDERKQVDLQ